MRSRPIHSRDCSLVTLQSSITSSFLSTLHPVVVWFTPNMAGGVVALELTSCQEKDRVLLVRSTDAICLCRDGAGEKLATHRAIGYLASKRSLVRTQVCSFILRSRLRSLPLARLEDSQLLAYLCQELKVGNLQVVRVSDDVPEGKSASSLPRQRRLIRSIEREAHHGLGHAGRRYRLVAGDDLRRMANRDQYEVVNRDDAIGVLEGLMRSDTALAKLLAEVRDQLSRDWKPPCGPDGLVMLRAIIQRQAAERPTSVEPRRARARPPADTAAEPEAPANEPEVDDPCQVSALIAASGNGVPFCRDYQVGPTQADTAMGPATDELEVDDSCQVSALVAASGDGVPFCRDYQV